MSAYAGQSQRALARAVVAAAVAAALVAIAIAIVLPSGASPPAVEPLRVTSGARIATGFAIGDDRVVTVAHALGGSRAITVRTGSRTLRARVLAVDRRTDLALLAAPGIRARRLEIASAAAGGDLRLVRLRGGHTAVRPVRVRRSIDAHVRAPGAGRAARRPALELAAHVRAGDSGAPALTRSGDLAGVVFATSRNRPGTAYAVDAEAVGRLMRR